MGCTERQCVGASPARLPYPKQVGYADEPQANMRAMIPHGRSPNWDSHHALQHLIANDLLLNLEARDQVVVIVEDHPAHRVAVELIEQPM